MAKWENPCPTLMLPDSYCKECQETSDVNLCYIPPTDDDDVLETSIGFARIVELNMMLPVSNVN
jgi:hypothetical protein